ncbi:hypothetical protein BFJ71_g1326 [Fusarium oxysporum]|nr:hypothetical protein BFJ71_g1326 [Fusarium oxysporum]
MSGFNGEYSLTLEFTIQPPSDSHYWYSHLTLVEMKTKKSIMSTRLCHEGYQGCVATSALKNQSTGDIYLRKIVCNVEHDIPATGSPGGACGQEVHPAPSIPPSISPLDTEGIAGEASST